MSRNFRIGDKVVFKDSGTYGPTKWEGEIAGTAILGSNVHTRIGSSEHFEERFEPHMQYVVRLKFPIIITPDKRVIERGAPSSHPGSLFIFELAVSGSSLIPLEE